MEAVQEAAGEAGEAITSPYLGERLILVFRPALHRGRSSFLLFGGIMSLQAAFDQVIADAVVPERWYVVLVEDAPYYGGPEEGGWYGHDRIVHAFKEYPTEVLADEAAEAVRKLASEMTAEAQQAHGRACLQEMEWLDARMLDADFLPEPDGPSDFSVIVTDSMPETRYGSRQYS